MASGDIAPALEIRIGFGAEEATAEASRLVNSLIRVRSQDRVEVRFVPFSSSQEVKLSRVLLLRTKTSSSQKSKHGVCAGQVGALDALAVRNTYHFWCCSICARPQSAFLDFRDTIPRSANVRPILHATCQVPKR